MTDHELDTTSIVHEIWGENAAGTHSQLAFLNRAETYDTLEQAQQLADRYNREQENWGKPAQDRIRCYVRSFEIHVTKTEVKQ